MDLVESLRLNLLSPVVLAFALGFVATLVKSDLKLPEAIHSTLSIYLLLAIGLKGGGELARTPFAVLWKPALASILLGVVTALLAFAVARRLGRLAVPDAAAMAATYGSVSIVTFSAALTFLDAVKVPYEPFMPTLVVLLEIPGIIVGLALARALTGAGGAWGEVAHEILAGRSVLLMLGGLVIGWLAGKPGMSRVSPLFVDLFHGAVMLFLLEMGMVAARRLAELRSVGAFLAGFAVVMPVLHGLLGVAVGTLAGLSLGGATVLGVLAASASYIAAPSAVRLALPEANPSYYLTTSLGITFPFNLAFGIPLFYAFARLIARG